VLAFGNYMNGGTARGQADGFSLTVLTKLRDVKTQDNSSTLVAYLVHLLCKDDPDSGTDLAQLPVPEPTLFRQYVEGGLSRMKGCSLLVIISYLESRVLLL
jgi:formin 2/formin-1